LVNPVLPTVRSALEQVDPVGDPWDVPRAGLGGAVVIHVAREFGMRRWRRAGRVAVVALEGYNQHVHRDDPDAATRNERLERDFAWLRRVWKSVLEHDSLTIDRVMDRLFGSQADLGDRAIPEAVLFLRMAVAAGVVAGAVPDKVHAALDRHATWLGLAWEANRGSLTTASWEGALDAIGLTAPFPDDADEFARERAVNVLDGLPNGPFVPLFQNVLDRPPHETPAQRAANGWQPLITPAPAHPRRGGLTDADALGAFSERWCAHVDESLVALAATKSTVLEHATHYLLGQGGKRVRPLVVLASALACGGSPRRALPVAAAIEWVHQGSLVLDDIIDEAPIRRGAPPLHEATSTPFAAGVTVFLLARVMRALHGSHPQIRKRLVDATSSLVTGERLELKHTGNFELTQTAYYQIIEAKTARLFSAAAAVGGLVSEAPSRHIRALSKYGHQVGLAFQLADDLLDYTGDESVLGKRPGTDLRAGKMTLPLLMLRQRLAADERERLAQAFDQSDDLDWIVERLHTHQVPASCRTRAHQHVTNARRLVASLPGADGRDLLSTLAERFAERRR